MGELSPFTWALLMEFLLPGLIAVRALSYMSATLSRWISASVELGPSAATAFIYVLLASLMVGLMLGVIRWATLDQLHSWTGIPRPSLDYSKLNDENVRTYRLVDSGFYRYYKFYGHSFVALAILLTARIIFVRLTCSTDWAIAILIGVAMLLLYFASRDSLKRTYCVLKKFLV